MTLPVVSFNPGPSQLLPGIAEDLAELGRSGLLSESHRGDRVRHVVHDARAGVARLLDLPTSHRVVFAGSATELMEACLRNLSRSRTFHLVCGAFSGRFRDIAATLGREALAVVRPDGEGFDLGDVEPPETDLVCLTQVETSTGVELDLSDLADWRARRPEALVAVDVVSSVPTRRLPWEAADCWLFSVQKGFGLPAGLGVALLSERALERAAARAKAGEDEGWLRRLATVAALADEGQTVETPNVLALALLARACRRLEELGGQDEIEGATTAKAEDLYGWLEAHPRLTPFVQRPRHRARTVAPVVLPAGTDAEALRAALADRGFVVGAGYGEHRASQLRIANFPAHAATDQRRLRHALDELL